MRFAGSDLAALLVIATSARSAPIAARQDSVVNIYYEIDCAEYPTPVPAAYSEDIVYGLTGPVYSIFLPQDLQYSQQIQTLFQGNLKLILNDRNGRAGCMNIGVTDAIEFVTVPY